MIGFSTPEPNAHREAIEIPESFKHLATSTVRSNLLSVKGLSTVLRHGQLLFESIVFRRFTVCLPLRMAIGLSERIHRRLLFSLGEESCVK